MKKVIGYLISVIAVLATVLGFAACADMGGGAVDPTAYSFVTIDINPSVELIALGNNVVEVKAANYDACVLLEDEDLSAMTIEEATAQIVSLAEEMGYLTDTNNRVKISVISDDTQAVELLKAAAKAGAQKGSKKAVATTETRLQDELTLKKLKAEKPDKFADLTEEKVRLIESIMEYDSSMTYEIGAEMPVKDLAETLKAALNENRDIFTSELRREYSVRYVAAKQEIERSIAEVYGEEYLVAWERYTALKNEYDTIVDRLEKSGLPEEVVAAVQEALQITDISLIEKGGVVRADYVLNYIDKHIHKKDSQISQSAVDGVLDLLDAYNAKNYILTDEEVADVTAAAGEEIVCTTLVQLKAEVSARKAALDKIKESLHLTSEQVAQIRVLKEGFASIKENVLNDMQEIIAAARADIAAAKQERGNSD